VSKSIYVGNLSYDTTEDTLRELFGAHGEVKSARVMVDRATGRSRGFGFVEMDDNDAATAIEALNGHETDGRTLTVNEAKPRQSDGGGGGGGGPRRQSRW